MLIWQELWWQEQQIVFEQHMNQKDLAQAEKQKD